MIWVLTPQNLGARNKEALTLVCRGNTALPSEQGDSSCCDLTVWRADGTEHHCWLLGKAGRQETPTDGP